MKFPTTFTYLAFYFNSLVDEGKSISYADLKMHLKAGDLFIWLKSLYGNSLDISLFSQVHLHAIQELFLDQHIAIDEAKKFGVENNGLCVLIAHCLNLIQFGEAEILKLQPDIFA